MSVLTQVFINKSRVDISWVNHAAQFLTTERISTALDSVQQLAIASILVNQ